MLIDDTETFLITPINHNVIQNSKGHTWAPVGSNIQLAINDLGADGGDVWLPATTLNIPSNIWIQNHGIRLHGWGDSTLLNFQDCKLTAYTGGGWCYAGLDNLLFENFKMTGSGGHLEVCVQNNATFRNINSVDLTQGTVSSPGAIRPVIPRRGARLADGLTIINCHSLRTWSHGIIINAVEKSTDPGIIPTIKNVLIQDCSAEWAGYQVNDLNRWAVGIDLCEGYWSPQVPDELLARDMLVQNCVTRYCWESGFHVETAPNKINVLIKNCLSEYNGQKKIWWINQGNTWPPVPYPSGTYCSGFIAMNKGMALQDCVSNYNSHCGYRWVSCPMTNCTGTGNWTSLIC